MNPSHSSKCHPGAILLFLDEMSLVLLLLALPLESVSLVSFVLYIVDPLLGVLHVYPESEFPNSKLCWFPFSSLW